MAFKTESAQSSWLPDQMLKRAETFGEMAEKGLSYVRSNERPTDRTAACREVAHRRRFQSKSLVEPGIIRFVSVSLQLPGNSRR